MALPAEEREVWTEADRLDLGAVMAGAITGYRSFRIASGLSGKRHTEEQILAGGLPRVLESHGSVQPGGASVSDV